MYYYRLLFIDLLHSTPSKNEYCKEPKKKVKYVIYFFNTKKNSFNNKPNL